jgi:hypothetical protein
VLRYAYIACLLLPNVEECFCTASVLCGRMCKSFVALRAEDLDSEDIVAFCFCPAFCRAQFYHSFGYCSCIRHCWRWIFGTKFSVTFFHDSCFAVVIKVNALRVTENISHTHWQRALYATAWLGDRCGFRQYLLGNFALAEAILTFHRSVVCWQPCCVTFPAETVSLSDLGSLHSKGRTFYCEMERWDCISLKTRILIHLINLSLISPTRFGASTHHHQGLRISCCETKLVDYWRVLFPSKKYAIPGDGAVMHRNASA